MSREQHRVAWNGKFPRVIKSASRIWLWSWSSRQLLYIFHLHNESSRFLRVFGSLRLTCDDTCAETRFRLSATRTSPFKSAGASVKSTTGSRGVHISVSNAGYTMFRGSVKGTGYPLHSPVSPSLPLPCITVCHHISTGLYTELFSAILISRIIFSCMFDIKCHNEIKCSMVVGNLFHLRLSSTITFKSLYFKLTRCVQLPFQLTCSLNPIRSSRVDSSVKVRKFSNVPGSSVPEMLDNFTP